MDGSQSYILDPSFDQAEAGLVEPHKLEKACMLFPDFPPMGYRAQYTCFLDDGLELDIHYVPTDNDTWKETEAWNDEGLPYLVHEILSRI
jgi:hypothetical protein